MNGTLFGFGTIAQGHLSAYGKMKELSITAIVEPSPERRTIAGKLLPGTEIFATADELFSQHKPDFIDICSPPSTHFEYISAGLLNGCHVLCEKPFLLSVEHYREIMNLNKNLNKIIYPCHNYKFSPVLKLAKEIVSSEQFGQFVGGHFRTLRAGHARGIAEWYPDWRRDRLFSGGGILRDHGTHSIYIACELCGRLPRAVSCLVGNLGNSNKYSETEDTALLTMHFDGFIEFHINLSWTAGGRNSYYSLLGSKENIIIQDDDVIRTLHDGSITRQYLLSEFNDSSHKSWFQDMFLDFLNVVENPERQTALLQEALITTLVIEQAYLSAQEGGRLIELPNFSDLLNRA